MKYTVWTMLMGSLVFAASNTANANPYSGRYGGSSNDRSWNSHDGSRRGHCRFDEVDRFDRGESFRTGYPGRRYPARGYYDERCRRFDRFNGPRYDQQENGRADYQHCPRCNGGNSQFPNVRNEGRRPYSSPQQASPQSFPQSGAPQSGAPQSGRPESTPQRFAPQQFAPRREGNERLENGNLERGAPSRSNQQELPPPPGIVPRNQKKGPEFPAPNQNP